jgi:hypothetical protein
MEAAILSDMERFLLEMGDGFCFVARQKRLIVGADDFYLDLLFYHRKLRRLVAVELKLERFHAAHKGQMELYLRWLDRHERQPGEEAPIGLILCASVYREEIEVLQLEGSSIRVAEYLVELPDREALRAKLHQAIKLARERAAKTALSFAPEDRARAISVKKSAKKSTKKPANQPTRKPKAGMEEKT